MSRECGECHVCCTVGGVPAIQKLPGQPCGFECDGCSLFGRPERPVACNEFRCAWLEGIGEEHDRPDVSGIMVSIADLNGGTFAFALETRRRALWGSGRHMIKAMASKIPLPIVVSRFESKYPNDTGDLVVVRGDLAKRAKKMMGAFVGIVGPRLNAYKVKSTKAA